MIISSENIKCVVWDLDNTVWDGIILEGDVGEIRMDVEELIRQLDARGVLQSVASRGDSDLAMAKLRAAGLDDVLLHCRIGWCNKSQSIREIAERLNIGLDTVVFVDDDPFERGEVAAELPSVRCISPEDLACLRVVASLPLSAFTSEARLRRTSYKQDEARLNDEACHPGGRAGFLRDAGMQVRLRDATAADLHRLVELVQRTNQMNSAGRFYSFEELGDLMTTRAQHVVVAEYEDRYGAMGTVGLAIVDQTGVAWTVKLLLVSCRVLSRGVGMTFLSLLAKCAADRGATLQAEYIPNGRNRAMAIALSLSGFSEAPPTDATVKLLTRDPTAPIELPPWLRYDLAISV